MVRTIGARDLKQRKRRSDFGSKRKTFAGKPVLGKREKIRSRRIGNKEYLKIFIWEERSMTQDGYRRFNRYIRNKMRKVVFYPIQVHEVHVSEINTREKIENFMADNYWVGTFLVKGFSNAKNRYHCKNVKMCRVVVKEREEGNVGKMTNNYRLHRYKWFYKG